MIKKPGTIIAATETTFVNVGPHSQKVMCSVCGRQGYDVGSDYSRSWAGSCMRGHGACLKCGLVIALNQNGNPRNGHKDCPQRYVEEAIADSAPEEAPASEDELPGLRPQFAGP